MRPKKMWVFRRSGSKQVQGSAPSDDWQWGVSVVVYRLGVPSTLEGLHGLFFRLFSLPHSHPTRYAQLQEKNTRASESRGLLPFGRFTGSWYRRFRDSIHSKGR